MADVIALNTDYIQNYANRINALKMQISSLDDELANFKYHTKSWEISIFDCDNKLGRIYNYLNGTADVFNQVEKELQSINPLDYSPTEKEVRNLRDGINISDEFITGEDYVDLAWGLIGGFGNIGAVGKLVKSIVQPKWVKADNDIERTAYFISDFFGVNSGIGKCVSAYTKWAKTTKKVSKATENLSKAVKNKPVWDKLGIETVAGKSLGFMGSFKDELGDFVGKSGTLKCVTKWAGVVADFSGNMAENLQKYGVGTAVAYSALDTAVDTVVDAGITAAVTTGVGVLVGATPAGWAAVGVAAASAVVSWGLDLVINKVSDGRFEDVGDVVVAGAKYLDDTVGKGVKKVKEIGKAVGKGAVKAGKAVAKWVKGWFD